MRYVWHSLFKNLIIIIILLLVGITLTVFPSKSGRHPPINHYRIVNQPNNAFTSYINYHDFHFVNNKNVAEPNDYSLHYNQTVNLYRHLHFADGNQRMNFKPYARLQNLDSKHNPQSIAITNHGMLYVTHRVDNRSEIQITRYHLRQVDHHFKFTNFTAGPVFRGGHGQGLAYNPKTHQLWMLTNEQGAANQTSIQEIGTHTLNPVKQINFSTYPYPMGDVLTFDKHGNAYTCTRTFNPRGGANAGSIKLYKGKSVLTGSNFTWFKALNTHPG